MNKDYYLPLEIPKFDDTDLNEEEIIKCKNLFEQIATLIRDRCGIFDIHIAFHTLRELNKQIIESIKINFENVMQECQIREYLKEKE